MTFTSKNRDDHRHSKTKIVANLGPTSSYRHQAEIINDIHRSRNIAVIKEKPYHILLKIKLNIYIG